MEQQSNWPAIDDPKFHSKLTRRLAKLRLTGPVYASPAFCRPGKSEAESEAKARRLFSYQKFVKEYMAPNTPYRGLLVYHGLGSGKTRSAIEVIKEYPGQVVILVSASLKATWQQELDRWAPKVDRDKISMISYNANTLLRDLGEIVPIVNRLIIIDEVHNVTSMIYNGGKSAKMLFDSLFRAQRSKIVALSATPVINFPYELAILFNILRGPVDGAMLFPPKEAQFERLFVSYVNQSAINERLYMARIAGLVSYFSGIKGNDQQEIIYPRKIDYPIENIPMSDYQFSVFYRYRLNEIVQEMKRACKNQGRQKVELQTSQGQVNQEQKAKSALSSFRARSRQACNFVMPVTISHSIVDLSQSSTLEQSFLDDIRIFFDSDEEMAKWYAKYQNEPQGARRLQMLIELGMSQRDITRYHLQLFTDKTEETLLELLETQSDIYLRGDNLRMLSPKMALILNALKDKPGAKSPALIYSNYLNLGGLRIMGLVLKAHGYQSLKEVIRRHKSKLTHATDQQFTDLLTEQFLQGPPSYLIYSGDDSLEDRALYLRVFNHPLNRYREICAVFMGTRAAAEGLSLKNITQVHIMEPHWNEVRIQQVIGRARRLCSHQDLPNNERVVHVYRYQMIFTEEQLARSGRIRETTDQYLYQVSAIKQRINDSFLQLLRNGAIDCMINWAHNADEEHPIECFEYDYPEQGRVSENIQHDIREQQIVRHKVTKVKWTTYLNDYAIKVTPDNKALLEWITLQNGSKIRALVLYDLHKVKAGNKFEPVKAVVMVKGKQKLIPASYFYLANIR